MADKDFNKEMERRYAEKHLENWGKNWRAWGSWFSWGSPVGLSIFLWTIAGIIWVLAHL
ncbi:MAG: hypothetical protein ACXWLH_05875 [Candidatus Saccharimonadales bacterium]